MKNSLFILVIFPLLTIGCVHTSLVKTDGPKWNASIVLDGKEVKNSVTGFVEFGKDLWPFSRNKNL